MPSLITICNAIGVYELFTELVGTDVSTKAYAIVQHDRILIKESNTMYRIVETDNFGGDYPDEKFVNIPYIPSKAEAEQLADLINSLTSDNYPRFYKAVEMPYELSPGFEP